LGLIFWICGIQVLIDVQLANELGGFGFLLEFYQVLGC